MRKVKVWGEGSSHAKDLRWLWFFWHECFEESDIPYPYEKWEDCYAHALNHAKLCAARRERFARKGW